MAWRGRLIEIGDCIERRPSVVGSVDRMSFPELVRLMREYKPGRTEFGGIFARIAESGRRACWAGL